MSVLPADVFLAGRKPRAAAIPRLPLGGARRAAEALALPAGLVVLWQAASSAGWLPDQILPAPLVVAHTFVDLCRDGELPRHLAVSFRRVAQGFALGGALGVALGAAMGLSRTAERALGPLFKAFVQVPGMAWLPLLMLVFGVGETLKVAAILKAVMVPLAITTQVGIRSIPAAHLELARALRLRPSTRLRQVILPAIFPPIFSGVRQGVGQAWVSLVGVELLASTAGLGYLMTWGRAIFQLDVVLSAVVVVGVVGVALDIALRRLEGRVRAWAGDRR